MSLWGRSSRRAPPDTWEAIYGDLAHRDPAEVARELGRVEALLRGMDETAVGSFGVPGSLVFGEAKELAAQARHFCEQQAR